MKGNDSMNIPMVDLKVQYRKLKDEFDSAVIGVMESCAFIMGPEVSAFEREVAEYSGVKHAAGVASGTDALLLAVLAAGIGKGDEVIVPAFTFIATSEIVVRAGAKPVFADVDPRTFTLDPEDVRRKITPATKAIIPVHLYGHPADMTAIMKIAAEHGLMVIEDCAQAQGALDSEGRKVGTIGLAGCFSFFPSKNLGGYGDGGMILTDDDSLYEQVRGLRNHGSFERYYHKLHGFNSRLDSMQAAILRVKLRHLDEWNEDRRRAAHRYSEGLRGTRYTPPFENPSAKHVFHQYTILVPEKRNELKEFLAGKGVASMIYYPVSNHLQEVYRDLGYSRGDLPVSEDIQNHVLSLPIYPDLQPEQTDYILAALKEFEAKELTK